MASHPKKICLSGQHAGQVLKQVMEHGCTFLPQNMLPVPSANFATHPSQTAYIQWPFQEPKLEVPTIYKAYGSGLCKGISPQNMALCGTVTPF